ncbi:Stage V sporulation protein R [Planctomycetales bacterium 10988]|nr:Stage V sporulation protein R [Planctomycetales bacterium 10988]
MPTQPLEHLPKELANLQVEIEGYATAHGLDYYDTIFEVVDYNQLNEIAAYGGFPTRYPHWRFGMEYEQLSKSYSYGLSKIYELVINNDPCYAYLLKCNPLTDQKLVMAHVYGHCDFFKNNLYFDHTNRKMMDQMANHAQRVRRYIDRFGIEAVETFIDACLSIDDLIDIHSTFMKRHDGKPSEIPVEEDGDYEEDRRTPGRFRAKNYLDPFVNPPDVLAAEAEARRRVQTDKIKDARKVPEQPMFDVLLFLLEHAPLKPWQIDILSIIRDEAYYFAPQGQTKIMNEGWASYWHSKLMTKYLIEPNDIIHYAEHHSGTVATHGGRLNPYKLGIELFRNIEERWDRGQFGKDWEECDDWQERKNWDTGAGLGKEKIYEVRRIHNDLTFIDTFLTPEFCHEQKLFSFGFNDSSEVYEIESREFPKIKQRLLFQLTNRGQPRIQVLDGNYKNRGELLLQHIFQGIELQMDYARDTLANLYLLWKRPVHLETVVDEVKSVLSFDGSEFAEDQGNTFEVVSVVT